MKTEQQKKQDNDIQEILNETTIPILVYLQDKDLLEMVVEGLSVEYFEDLG